MAASVRVLDTVELLEHILYKLPMRDLLLSQRVCKQWQAVIKASKKLQCALFFEPLDGSPLLAVTQGQYRLRFIRAPSAGPYKYENASWRKMLVSQPTTTTICTMTGMTGKDFYGRREEIEFVRWTGQDSMGTIFPQILEHWDGEKLKLSSGDQQYYQYPIGNFGGLDVLYTVASNEDLGDIAAALRSRPMPES
ncbi:hypothetical protein LTR37_018334 [Vermiconidia calcicola]|uniref:Uncharacterized protein n=1 Tax=Vermiconidia calcicola TaxID=1690605 RepID=A0ACC3MHB6_9PEZI|nr:hypothetical protein LTR37_018334 [Vermiconidia calcicola]